MSVLVIAVVAQTRLSFKALSSYNQHARQGKPVHTDVSLLVSLLTAEGHCRSFRIADIADRGGN